MVTFFNVLTEAMNDMIAHGYDSESRVEVWLARLRESAMRDMVPDSEMKEKLNKSLDVAYRRMMKSGVEKVDKYTFERVKPKLKAEFGRRVAASVKIVERHRIDSVERMLTRFEGWATSIPSGGTRNAKRVEEKRRIRKSLARLPLEQRRVVTDQTHKMITNFKEIVAVNSGAIAARWHSNWRLVGYDYRPDHKERDEKVYIIRSGWAFKEKLIKSMDFTDQITKPCEEPFCKCHYEYFYKLEEVEDLLTRKGKKDLQSKQLS